MSHVPCSPVRFGSDRVLSCPALLTGRIGLVTNAAARTAARPRLPTRLALSRAGFRLVRLWSPEHGLDAGAADGAPVADSLDPLTGLPVISLYGARLRPAPEQLADLDTVAFDVPDIGARFYTYIWTLSHMLEACAEARKPLVVLDRPNPLGGELAAAEGPVLDPKSGGSFLGRAAIPIRHCLTAGELALLWNAEWNLGAAVQVVRCDHWRRSMHWPETGLPFVPTSPAISSYESALLYPGLCLFEATNLSVGRGTPLAFQTVGAPWLEAAGVAARFNAAALPGVVAEPGQFKPAHGPYCGQLCRAVRLQVTAPKQIRPVAAGLVLLATVIATHGPGWGRLVPTDGAGTGRPRPEFMVPMRAQRTAEPPQGRHFRWARYPTAANPGGEGHFERLVGRTGLRELLEEHPETVAARVPEWTAATGWEDRVEPHLLYT